MSFQDGINSWYNEITFKYKAGISNYFIITGNIYDIVSPGENLTSYLLNRLSRKENFKFVYVYSPGGEMAKYFPDWRNSCLHDIKLITSTMFDHRVSISDGKILKTATVVDHAEYFFPNCDITDRKMEQILLFKEAVRHQKFITGTNLLILITDDIQNLHPQITDVGANPTIIDIPYPSEEDRLDYINFLDKTSSKEIVKEITNEEFAKATVGLTYKSIEDIYLQSEAMGVLKRDFVIDRKNDWIKSEFGDVLDVLDVEGYNFDAFAGQDHLKKYHREVIIEPLKNGNLDIIPKGLLYTGPPGTGKTYFAKCFAGEAKINFVEFKLSKIMHKYVGESERNLAKALNCLQSIAPVGVFVDEIDQVFTKVEDSNGVKQSMFQMILSFLSDPKHRGKIIWIGATNYPNNLDEALKRTGRFDKKMPFLPPELNDRIETFKIHINKFSIKNNLTEEDYLELGNKTEGYTQAEIEGIVMKAMELAIRNQYDSLNKDTFLQALKYTIKASNEKINEMINLAISECNDLEFLPEKYWNNPNLGGV